MKTYIKFLTAVFLFSSCVSVMAENEFIVKYKPSEDQQKLVAQAGSSGDAAKIQAANDQIRKELMQRGLSQAELGVLTKVANSVAEAPGINVAYVCATATGAYLIRLSRDLDKVQSKRFITEVAQLDNVERVEANEISTIDQQ